LSPGLAFFGTTGTFPLDPNGHPLPPCPSHRARQVPPHRASFLLAVSPTFLYEALPRESDPRRFPFLHPFFCVLIGCSESWLIPPFWCWPLFLLQFSYLCTFLLFFCPRFPSPPLPGKVGIFSPPPFVCCQIVASRSMSRVVHQGRLKVLLFFTCLLLPATFVHLPLGRCLVGGVRRFAWLQLAFLIVFFLMCDKLLFVAPSPAPRVGFLPNRRLTLPPA